MRRFLFVILAMGLGGLAEAQAPPETGSAARFSQLTPTDDEARAVLELITANITKARDEKGQQLRPLTAEEAKTPLLDLALVKEIMDVARASAAGEACKLDWTQDNYLKLMRRERARGGYSTHQIAAISMVHGFTSGKLETSVCPDGARERVADFYRRKWQ
jgi:hypothetical protein